MTLATYSGLAPRERTETRTLIAIVWGATVVTYLAAGLGVDLSTDDAMRLVQVRDLLAGQNWFDLTQYRLHPPVLTHWSRLIDLPLAALIRAGEAVLTPARAEQLALVIWPAVLLLAFLAGVARLARELAGDTAARLALIFAALMAPVLQHFRPGAIDHHNVQLALLVWALACAVRPQQREAAIAGMLCALSIAIGQEMAPAMAALAAMMALRWIAEGDAVRQPTIAFALAFAGATVALFAATVAPSHYAAAACDALSIVQLAAVGIGGGGLAVLAAMRRLATPVRRLAAATALAALLAVTMAVAFPACLGDPYRDLDPRLVRLWLDHVSEARSILAMLRDLPQEVLPYYGLLAIGLAAGVIRCRERDDARWTWMIGTALLAVLSALALWQVRSAAAANAIAIALLPAALVCMFPARDRAVFFGLGRTALIAAALVSPLTLIAIGALGARAFEAATGAQRPTVIADGPGTCRRAADYAALKSLPPGRVAGFIDAGPFLLMETPHSVLAAPYHRNTAGNAAMLDLMLGPPDAARLTALGVTYVAFCPGSPERFTYAAAAPEGLAAALGRGEVPAFLERVALDGTELQVYRPRQ